MYSSYARLRVRGRRAAVLVAAVVTAVAASGCATFVSQPAGAQAAPNGDVAVSSSVCVGAWWTSPPPTDAADCISAPYTTSYYGQLLIAYLVPDGTSAPSSFSSADLGGISFSPSTEYTNWLTTQDPPPAGSQWFGYLSSEGTITQTSEIDVTADFGLPPAAAPGAPYSGPFVVPKVAIGERDLNPSGGPTVTDPNTPLDCSSGECSGEESADAVSVDTRALTTTAPAAAVTVQAGSTATIPFTVEYAGPAADPFGLSASTSSNALAAAPVNQTFTPSGTGNTTEDVSVPVPAGLAPGSYTVTLNVGAFASTAATLNVTAAPVPTATTTATTTTTVAPQQTAAAVRPEITGLDVNPKSLRLTLRLNIAATERLTLQRLRAHRWITLKKLATHGSVGANSLRLRALFGSLLNHRGRYRLVVSAVNGTVGSVSQSLTFTIR